MLMQQQQHPRHDPPSSWNAVSSYLQIDPPSCAAAAAHRHGRRALEVAGVGREEEEEAGDAQTGAETADLGLTSTPAAPTSPESEKRNMKWQRRRRRRRRRRR